MCRNNFKILVIFVVLILIPALSVQAVDNLTTIKVVKALNEYQIEDQKKTDTRNRIIKALNYGISEDIIFNLLDNDKYSNVKVVVNQLNQGINLNLDVNALEKAYKEDELAQYVYNMQKKAANTREYIIKYYADSKRVISEDNDINKVWMPIPQYWYGNSTSDLEILAIDPSPDEIYKDEHGNKVIYWSNLSSGHIYSIEFKIKLNKNRHNISSKKYNFSYNKDSDIYKKYTESNKRIQSEDNRIKTIANEINHEEEDPYLKVENIVRWINNNLSYGEGSRDALSVIKYGNSDCAGFANAFVALARASGIPARIISVLHPLNRTEFQSGKLFDTLGAHIIAEFYLQDYGWVEIDPGDRYTIGDIPYFYIVMTRGSFEKFNNMEYDYEDKFFHLPQSNFQNLEPYTGIEVEKIN